MVSALHVEVNHTTTLNFAMEQAGVPVVFGAYARNDGPDSIDDAVLTVEIAPGIAAPVSVSIAKLSAGEAFDIGTIDIRLTPGRLRAVTEAERAHVIWRVTCGGETLASGDGDIEVLAFNEWAGLRAAPALLATFVMPNHPLIGGVLRRVRDHLHATTGDNALSAYQKRSAERVEATVRALYETIQALGISYVVAPASFEETGQKVRFADAVIGEQLGNCLDLSLLVAACLEQMGLHPIVVLVKAHAFPGVWLVEERFPECVVYDAARLRTGSSLGQLLFLDSTAIVHAPAVSFDGARRRASDVLSDDSQFQCAIDVRVARTDKYRPLPIRDLATDATGPEQGPTRKEDESDRSVDAADPSPAARTGPPASTEVTDRFRRWREQLLDLSLRNKLLNFRRDIKTVLPLEVPDIAIFEDLLAADTHFEVLPKPDHDPLDERMDKLVDARVDASTVRDSLLADMKKGVLHSPYVPAKMLAHAVALDRTARSDFEEGGSNTLFVALGFLRWFESNDSQEPRLAPLLLLPVAIDYKRTTRRVRIRRLEDDPLPNQTLIEKLLRDFAVDLSPLTTLENDESGLDIPSMLRLARTAIQRMPRWEVVEEAHLGLFTFAKFLMWRDLDENTNVLLENDIVRHIALGRGSTFTNRSHPVDPRHLDHIVPPEQLPLVLDADSTQTAAVVAALAGRTFVLQGPPGTGKSQTITNVIGAAIAANKTVLFVSEKMAALEVVHRRLQQAGLGDFCLELHSNKAQKKEVLASLTKTLNRAVATPTPPWSDRSHELGRKRGQLNAYPAALHAPRPLGRTFYRASSRLLSLASAKLVRLDVQPLADVTEPQFRLFLAAAQRLADAGAEVEPIGINPWRGYLPPEWSARAESRMRDLVDGLDVALQRVTRSASPLVEILGISPVDRIDHLDALAELGAAVSTGPLPPHFADDASWAALRGRSEAWIAASVTNSNHRADLAARWREDLFSADLDVLHARFVAWGSAFFILAWFFLFSSKSRLRSFARGPLPRNDLITSDLARATASRNAQPAMEDAAAALRRDLGSLWTGDTMELAELLRRGDAVRAAISQASFVDSQVLARGVRGVSSAEASDAIRRHATELASALRSFWAQVDELRPLVGMPLGTPDRTTTVTDARRLVDTRRAALPTFRRWCFYQSAWAGARSAGLATLAEMHAEGQLNSAAVLATAERAFLESWVATVRDEAVELRTFDGASQHRLVDDFRQADVEHIALGRQHIVSLVEQRLSGMQASGGATSEPGILRREAMKKTRHMALRRLLLEIPNLLTRLKPCLMMSPLSVAQYLPAGGRRFDLVVFDEASQICTHDAIGAIARGNQLLVVGDSKQLPPTSFFQRGTSDDATTDESGGDELESVLDEALASGIPQEMLGWHYRSRHETLIEFSNQHYYDGRLHVFPAAQALSPDLGVHWHAVPDGIYDAGKTRTNRREAIALVDHLVASLRSTTPAERTYGVVTFSQAQQALIEDLLDDARVKYPELEKHFSGSTDESVFVKNLENVQGDERDEILFSIGYGPDERGRLVMNFGPLNRTGGERRLNVAITRARGALHVFSTLTHDRIDLARTTARGARDLKAFLRFVSDRGGPIHLREQPPGDFDSDFEREVCDALVASGHRVTSQVGCGGYRIDLAIRHPANPGVYALGVECDGAAYHSAATARDRDRLRQSVLEGLGWRMHRIWSTDWSFDRDRELARLEDALQKAITLGPAVGKASPALVTVEVSPLPVVVEHVEQRPAVSYARAQLRRVSTDPEALYANAFTHLLRDNIAEVVRVEAPIHADELARRAAASFGVDRLTVRVRRRVLEVLSSVSPRASLRGDFVWSGDPSAATLTVFRFSETEEERRDADALPPEEIAVAAQWLLSRGLSMPEDDLLRETARAFGLARLGQKVSDRMLAGIELLVSSGTCEREAGRVVWRG